LAILEECEMAASALYQALIRNPMHNIDLIRQDPHAMAKSPAALGLLPETMTRFGQRRPVVQQFRIDAAMWYGALHTGPFDDIIRKIFHLFYYAGVIYRAEAGWNDWAYNRYGNVASLLSHGQRVLVQLPIIPRGGGQLWPWLNAVNPILPRRFATHGLTVVSQPEHLIMGHLKYLNEEKGYFQAIKGYAMGSQYAFDPALGGFGNRNPFSATNDDVKHTYTPIAGGGSDGHVFIHYHPPGQDTRGGLLIGCENTSSGHHGGNPHTKASHSATGVAQKTAACGGQKWSELRVGPVIEYNGFICDLTDRGANLDWVLHRPLFNEDYLDAPTMPVGPIFGR
jgi:hypothetical protein